MESLIRDVRYSLRQLQRAPFFAVVAIVVLALGIGANTAIFSIADAVLFRAPQVQNPDELAVLYTTCRRGAERCSSSYPDYESYREMSTTFVDLAATSWTTANLGSERGSRLLVTMVASGNYYDLLGTRPALGRLIRPEDDGRGPNLVTVLSHRLWRDHFAADSSIVGSSVRLNQRVFTVVGVTPEGFEGVNLGAGPDITIPMWAATALDRSVTEFDARGSRWIAQLVGRLAPGASVADARSEMRTVATQLNDAFPDQRQNRTTTIDAAAYHALPAGQPSDIVRFVMLLGGIVALTLLLACANLANLLLMRATGRQREIAIRMALGSGRGRLVSQLITESSVLALLGGGLGLFLAMGLLQLLGAFELPGNIPIASLNIGIDTRILFGTATVSLLTGILFGIVPALHVTRPELVPALKGATSEAGGGHAWLRKSFVAAQVGLCLVLLVASGLFLRTLGNALTYDPGFNAEGTALARFDLSLLRYDSTRAQSFGEELDARLRTMAGVEAVGVGTIAPFQRGGFRGTFASVVGYDPAPDEEMRIDIVFVRPDYFKALGFRLADGRTIAESDRQGTAPVMVVNRAMAERYWRDGDAVGGTVEMGNNAFNVVGVIEDATWRTLGEETTSFVFMSMGQFPSSWTDRSFTLAVRTVGDPAAFLSTIRQTVASIEPELSIADLQTMNMQFGQTLMPQRMGALLLSMFGALAVVLAAVGIYGVVGFSVSQHQRTIGIRMALGANARDVVRMISKDMLRPIMVGIVAGGAFTLALASTLERFMFDVGVRDPLTILAIAVLLGAIALLATWIPARRAVAIAPSDALRTE